MYAIIAAVCFGLALLFDLIDESLGVIGVQTLTLAGLLFLALQWATAGGGRRFYGRRPGRG